MTAQYSSLKPSKNKFNGQIPSHWNDVPIRSVCKIKSVQNNIGEELLSVFLDRGVVRYSDTSGKQVHKPSDDMSKYQLVEPRDIVLNNQQAWRGSVGVSQYRGIVSPAYIVMSLDESINDRFVNYMIRNQACVAQFVLASKGVGSIQRILSPTKLKSSFFTLPPREEQDRIVKYLDWKISTINKLINSKRKHIAHIEALKHAFINRTVTLGINKKTSCKQTNVTWIGKIPKHWNVKPLCALAKIKSICGVANAQLLSVYLDEGVVPFSSRSEKRTNATSLDLSKYQLVENGDFVLNNQQAWRGSVGVSNYTGIVSPAYIVLSLDTNELDQQYANYLFRSRAMVDQYLINSKGVGSIQRNLYWSTLKRISVVIPPKNEQLEIVNYIKKSETQYNNIIIGLKGEVEHFEELKKKLISDAITGKIDVRGIYIPEYEGVDEVFDAELLNDDVYSSEVD